MARSIEDFEIVKTADGSPSLSIADASGYVEKMHHSHGALSESIYIYYGAAEEVIRRGWPLRVLSVGLGLGYNELLSAAAAIKAESQAVFHSFEIEPVLTKSFVDWVFEHPSPFASLYSDIAHGIQAILRIRAGDLRSYLQIAHTEGRWHVKEKFPDEAASVRDLTCVFYDAFSNKMSPELWSESLIQTVIKEMCAPQCVFTTYAATGALKRALRTEGFEKVDRPGFSGKRESTLAIRDRSN